MIRMLIDAPRWLLLMSLVYAPWAFGCTRPWTIELLEALLGTILVLWIASCALRRTFPPLHPIATGSVLFLLLQGWGMTANAHWLFDTDYFRFVPIPPWWPAGPGTVDRAASMAIMWRVTALLGVVWMVTDVSRHAAWRLRLWWTITFTGASLLLFGLVQKFAGIPFLPFEDVRPGSLYFATFFYHGNAGAFINLVLPLAIGLTAVALRKSVRTHVFLVPASVICLAGAFTNASRAAAAIALLMLAALAVWQFRMWRRDILAIPRKAAVIYLALGLIGFIALVLAVLPQTRWAQLPGQMNGENPRWISTQVLLRMLPDAGAWGLGPGTFALTFPHYTRELGTAIRGIWRFAHEDYLQTLVEWGWAGSIAWAVLFFGGMLRSFHYCRRLRTTESTLLFTSGLALAGVALHALVDFPLQIASLQLYAAVYVGLGWAGYTWTQEGIANHASAPPSPASATPPQAATGAVSPYLPAP